MKLTYDHHEFSQRVREISDYDKLTELGFTTQTLSGIFFPSDANSLLRFCAENPEYHLTSSLGNCIIVNRYEPQGKTFKLAEGDRDPEYALDASSVVKGVLSMFLRHPF